MKRKSRKKKIKVTLLVLALPILMGSVYFLSLLIFRRTAASFLSKQIDAAVNEAIIKTGLDLSSVHKNYVRKHQGHQKWEQVEVVINLNGKVGMRDMSIRLQQALDFPGVTVKEVKLPRDNGYNQLQLSVYVQEAPLYRILLKRRAIPPSEQAPPKAKEQAVQVKENAPKIALIIDDVGYDVERALELINLHQPMTISIFPQLRNSRHIAEIAHQMGYEVMMHLPMEADEHLRRNPGFIMESMSRSELFDVLDKDLESISYVSGVNNHQGSKMTKERLAMGLVMEHLAQKKLYFIDSRTTRDSVAYIVAKEYGLKAGENDFFLDNEKDPEYIKERFLLLMEKAQEKGAAIGICHVHPVTIQTLRQMIPLMEQKGIRLVYASQVVE
jgi:hypothetical protein